MSVVTRIRAWPRNALTGAAVAIFLAGGNNGAPHYDGSDHYLAGIVAHPRFEAALSFDEEGWSARAVPAVSAIGWQPAEPSRLDPVAALYWRDAAIEVDRISGNAIQRRLTGTVAEATIKDGVLVITCADLSNRLDKPFATGTFAGTGGIEGGESATGRVKRRSFGKVWNVEGRLLDAANNIYEFGDPAFPLQGCSALRDMGRAGPLGIVAWQGSIDATLAVLKLATPERGGGVFAPSIACGKWWTQPAGPLTADLLGEAAGYSQTAAGIAAQLLASAGGPGIANLAAASALRPAACGLHIGDGTETCATALDRLLQRVTLIWQLTPLGQVDIQPWTFDGPIETLRATFISRESTVPPVYSRQVGYKRNERVHGDGEISITLLASDVVYEDGTSVEDLKPAEPGATAGSPSGTNIGDVTVDDIVAAIKAIGLTTNPADVVAGAQRLADAVKALALTTNAAEIVTGAQALADAVKALAQATNADDIVAGAQALVDRARSADMAALDQLLLNQERREYFDNLTHLDGVPVGAKITEETVARVEGYEALASTIVTLEAVMTVDQQAVRALVQQEATARANADSAEALSREVLIAEVRTEMADGVTLVQSQIVDEALARTNADLAETEQRNLAISELRVEVDGQIDVVTAAIATEAITRASADLAETEQRQIAVSRIDSDMAVTRAAITSEATTRATADAAETLAREAAISSLQTVDASLSAAIVTEATTRATNDAAETSQRQAAISSLQSADAYLNAALTTESTTRATADEAEATARQALAAQVASDIFAANAAIEDEATARATADLAETAARNTAISTLQTTINGQISTAMAAITSEATTRASADLAETTAREGAISSLTTAMDGHVTDLEAAIASEATTRATNDAAETSQRQAAISSLQSADAYLNAALTTELTTRATADEAEATARQALAAQVGSDIAAANAAIEDEATARATADLAETAARNTAISTLQTTINGQISTVMAAITSEATTRASADLAETTARNGAISSLTTAMDGHVTDLEAAIASEATTRATNDAAETSQRQAAISSLQSADANLNAALTTEATTRASADAAEVTAREAAVALLQGDIDNVAASVITETSARVSADAALASQITGVETTLGDHSASITELLESVDGVLLRYGLKLDSNGHIVGFMANNDGEEGGFDFVADYFRIWDADGTISQAVFDYSGGVLKMHDVEVDKIKAGSGNSAQFANAAASASVPGSGFGNDILILTKTIELLAPASIQAVAAIAVAYAGSVSNSAFSLVIGGQPIFSVGGATTEISIILAGSHSLAAGTHAVEIYFSGPSNMSVHGRNLSTTIVYT
ncbi:hypothetical protein [Sphingobium sp. YR768]|uniref:hypothetical protein n=1 Tax=Sphingobium sp. YR768 TaxID=1884365 RepID=UPI0008CF861A|nr:hypothetical protein [Sphingobium sp. YR768]SER09379.1 hypothetical protein SAMN05518866_1053 [Sphingobium sp. YR768]